MEEEIDINFRLDRNGRTLNTAEDDNANRSSEGDEKAKKDAANIDFQSKVTMTNLTQSEGRVDAQQLLDDLLFDCEISDSGLLPRTFWISADSNASIKPRCTLEQYALDIFHHHVPASLQYDPTKSGVEWWCQIRPSPEGTGRYSMHDKDPDAISKTGISWHWDKDEDLRLLTGGTTYIHPYLSTVTYLTDFGSPTVAVNCRVNNLTGRYIVPGQDGTANEEDDHVKGYVCWPKTGKHMSFDGRYLHAALPNFMEPGEFEKQITYQESDDNDPKQNKILKRRHRRVTFLVNIWLNYQPFDTRPFPETMIDKLSGSLSSRPDDPIHHLTFLMPPQPGRNNSNGDDAVILTGDYGTSEDTQKMVWPMGDCSSPERLEALIPLKQIRSQATCGGQIGIEWALKTQTSFRLYEEKEETQAQGSATIEDAASITEKKREVSSLNSEGGVDKEEGDGGETSSKRTKGDA